MIKSKNITKHLTVADFKDVKFMTATAKLKTAKQWEQFVRARCSMRPEELKQTEYGAQFKPWTKTLYHHFSQHLGHIAHFNMSGFFHEQWLHWSDFLRNMENLAADRDNIGAPMSRGAWGANSAYEDLGHWIVEVAKAYLPEIQEQAGIERRRTADAFLNAAQREYDDAHAS